MKKVYILLTDTGTLFTRMIKMYTRKQYNHSSVSFELDFNKVYSFGRKIPHNPFIGGFVKENIRGNLFQNARCAIYSCKVTRDQLEIMENYIKGIEEHSHLYKYNLLGLFSFLLNKPIKREKAFFCSQFVGTVLYKGGVADFKKPLELVTPSDLENLENFHLEYEGELAKLVLHKQFSMVTNSPVSSF
ncbi:hypothetical protein [Oceanobacillus halophilus]|uniref:Uncharacterized protein n=1 Tax=Oceanobacillus halophilus TaxID=930130 RepID=A0A494ZSG5_9BACI|nr:hypothetical protein [Oceanobacillus halophilus]RKQ28790.1 hypothetical protein D8M06_18335 [Oceanobacillus halophilus]